MTSADSPQGPGSMMSWAWPDIEPQYAALEDMTVSAATGEEFLRQWTAVSASVQELHQRLYVATTQNTADDHVQTRYRNFLDDIYPHVEKAEQRLREKLLAAQVDPPNFDQQLRSMRSEVQLYREENIPLAIEEQKLEDEYNAIIGGQTVHWDGRDVPVPQMMPYLQEQERGLRERVWNAMAQRRLLDRDRINDLWSRFLSLRLEMARNAGYADYRSFRWQQLQRFDYTPNDAMRLHGAIEEVMVPAAERIFEKRRRRLGLASLRPWDLDVDPSGSPPLRPFRRTDELIEGCGEMFRQVDAILGNYFTAMVQGGLLDLDNRVNKAPGGYCTSFAAVQQPFIFMNAVGMHDDVQTLLHEGGHAFHVFEERALPYVQQRSVGMEFAEVASMAMEFLASPHLPKNEGGFYSDEDSARARLEHIENTIALWPRLAMVDAFQHWLYEHPVEAADPDKLGSAWVQLASRFVPYVDWDGLEPYLQTGWHNILHIHVVPFYIIEYALAQLGAVQIWANARRNGDAAVAQYRYALSLGGTRALPDLYAAAGARLAFDAAAFREALTVLVETAAELEPVTDSA